MGMAAEKGSCTITKYLLMHNQYRLLLTVIDYFY